MSELDDLYKSLMNEPKEKTLSVSEIIKEVLCYWNYLWSKKWIIIACAFICSLLGLGLTMLKHINYEAKYVFSIGGGSSSSAVAGLGSLSSLLGLGSSSMGAFSGDNIVELFKSRSLMERTLLSPVLYNGDSITFIEYALIVDSVRVECSEKEIERDEDSPISICDITYPLGQPRNTFTRAQDSILVSFAKTFLMKNVFVEKRDKKLSYVEYSFTSGNEMFSKLFAEAHLNEVSDFYVQTKTELSRKNIESFQIQADSVRKELNKALSVRAVYADENRNAARQIVGVQLLKTETDIQILGAAYAEMIKNIEMLKLDLARETPLIQVIDEPANPLPNDKGRKLKGIVVGGFFGGFLSCLAFVAILYFKDMKKKVLVELNSSNLPSE